MMIKAITSTFLILMMVVGSAIADSNPLKVGVIIPLTGSAAEYGVAAQNGMRLAEKTTPHLFENIKLVFEDSRHDASLALTALKKLQTVDDVDAVISWGVGPTQAVAPITEQSKIPLIAITAESTVSDNRRYVVRFNYTAQQYANALVQYLRGCGRKKIGIVKAENPYFQNIFEGMKPSLGDEQNLDITASVQTSDADFRSIIPRVASKHYDAVGVFLVTGQISAFYQQALQLKFNAPFFGTDFFESRAEVEKAGPAIQGTVYPSMNVSDDFRSRYVSAFGNDLQIAYAGNAYDAAVLTAQSLQDSVRPLNPSAIIARMMHSNFDGVSGRYRVNNTPAERGFDPELVIKRVDSNGISVVGTGECRRTNESTRPGKQGA